MSRVRLSQGLHFWLQNREYVIIERWAGGCLKVKDVVDEKELEFQEKELVLLLFQGELEFESPENSPSKSFYYQTDFSQISDALKAEANRKQQYIEAVLSNNLDKYTLASLTPIIESVSLSINDQKKPSYITVYRWIKDYENSGGDIRSLIPRYSLRGNYLSKLDPAVKKIIDEVIDEIYMSKDSTHIANVYYAVIAKIAHENTSRKSVGIAALELPHRSTVYRWIHQIDPYAKNISRYGYKIASLLHDPTGCGPRPKRILERVEIDHTKLPFFVVDEETRMPIGTPSLTSAVDKYSGVIVGYYLSFEPFSSLSVMQCLLNSIQPKDYVSQRFPSVENTWNVYGLMETLVVDNGKEFYSEHFKDACKQLGIIIQYTPPYMPWYKSSVERTFSSYNTQLLVGQPGTLLKEFSNLNGYNPKKNAVVSLSALEEMVHIFIIDIHNQSFHSDYHALRAEVWNKAMAEYPPALPDSHRELRVLLGAVEQRVITKKGVEFHGLFYNSPELARLRSTFEVEDLRRQSNKRSREKATIKYDPTDLSKIYIFDPEQHQFILVPAVSQEYTRGLTLWQHRVIKNLAASEAQKVDIVALALAKEKIQKIVEREWQDSHLSRGRKSMARWLGIGREQLSIEDLSSISKSELDVSESHVFKPTTENKYKAQPKNISDSKFTKIQGISDFESAFNSSSKLEKCSSEIPKIISENLVEQGAEKNQKSPGKKKKKNPNLPDKTDERPDYNQTSEVVESSQNWLPDLSGWDISYGFPPI